MSFKVDNKMPNLINLNEDPQLCEILVYALKEGSTSVGRQSSSSLCDIQLTGALIAPNHWYTVGCGCGFRFSNFLVVRYRIIAVWYQFCHKVCLVTFLLFKFFPILQKMHRHMLMGTL